MICRDDIISEVEKELDDLLAAAPENLSETLRAVKEESIGYTKHVLNSLTTKELQSAGAYNSFLENVLLDLIAASGGK